MTSDNKKSQSPACECATCGWSQAVTIRNEVEYYACGYPEEQPTNDAHGRCLCYAPTWPESGIGAALIACLSEHNASPLSITFDPRERAGHVLAVRNAGTNNAEYVVWGWVLDDDGTASLYWGHYFTVEQYDDAVADLKGRTRREEVPVE